MAARPSYCSGSKSLRAAVKYSPAGVVFTISELDFTTVIVPPSFLSTEDGKAPTLFFLEKNITAQVPRDDRTVD